MVGEKPMKEPVDSEIASLAEQDQNDRGEYLKSPTPEKWNQVTERDKLRRARVVELMQEEKISTADDYFNAGLIMIHGDTTEDSIMSHVLAMAAMAKGHPAAAWLSAVSLDEMMHSLKKGQVFDTYPPEDTDNEKLKTVFITESIKAIFKPHSAEEDSV
jgi:hypothetical protein